MICYGLNNITYKILRELGRGGEGIVYEVDLQPDMVLKLYTDPLTPDKVAKLRAMTAMRSTGIEAYAAWPTDVVSDDKGNVVGFVMRKLAGFVPLHMIFSPMDRKKMFPDKGYNFLVHVARNLATAFFRLHEAGLVIGDVNEGNILINAAGMVAFIDCDSFQLKSERSYFFCEVGVPRYTPPELLIAGTFSQVVRTVNTDSFSIAVLIFQLLFLGRHPFAGKNKLAADFDEETAIRTREFAYSLENTRKKLFPPNDSFAITNLSAGLVSLFHRAFEQDSRPAPAEWIKALDAQLLNMVTCHTSRLHSYPSGMKECPWCQFRQSRGIMYFLDDSYLKATAFLGDIEGFVNGFNVQHLELKKWEQPPDMTGMAARPIDKRFQRYQTYKWGTIAGLITFCIIIFTLHLSALLIIAALAICFAVYAYSPWTNRLNAELNRLRAVNKQLTDRLSLLIAEYNRPSDLASYENTLGMLQKYVSDFRQLPQEVERRRKIMEEWLFHQQLTAYLDRFHIDAYDIPSFGATRKQSLAASGIRTAGDVSKLATIKVPGVGPKNLQVLLSWQRQMAAGYVYIPDQQRLAAGMQEVTADVAKIKARLETLIRKEYQALNHLRTNIANRAAVLEAQITDTAIKAQQAQLDIDAFGKLAA